MNRPLFWIFFNVFALFVLAVDLWMVNQRAHAVNFREGLARSLLWITLAAGSHSCLFPLRPRDLDRVRRSLPGRILPQR